MVATIKGEYYNTDKARVLATSTEKVGGVTKSSTVYKAIKHGSDARFFLLYLEIAADSEITNKKVVPLTEEDAKRTTQRMLSAEDWDRIWDDVDAGPVPCHITAKKSVNDEFRRLRQAAGMKSGEFLEVLINTYKGKN